MDSPSPRAVTAATAKELADKNEIHYNYSPLVHRRRGNLLPVTPYTEEEE